MKTSPAPRLNSMVIVMQDPLDSFNITFGLHSQEVTAKINKKISKAIY